MSFYSPGMEAIDFQRNTSFGRKMTALFQDVIDYRDKLEYETSDAESQREDRIRYVAQYFNDTVPEKFKKLVKDETGLIVREMITIGGVDHGAYGYFACDTTFESYYATVATAERMTSSGNSNASKQAVADMAEMANILDTRTGRLKKDTFGKDKPIYVDIYFDINTAFCAKDFALAKTFDEFTAGEIAAIMMHEIGHAITFIEHTADMYVIASSVRNHLKNLRADSTGQQSVLFLKTLKEQICPILDSWSKKKVMEDPKMTSMVKNVSSTMSTLISKVSYSVYEDPNTDESWFTTFSGFTGHLLIAALEPITNVIVSFFLWLFCVQLYETMRHSTVDVSASGGKAGDVYTNPNNLFLLERWADEYAVRQGLGSELSSGLNKLDDFIVKGLSLGIVYSARLRHSTMFNCLGAAVAWFEGKFALMSYLDPINYEGNYARNARILEDTLAIFKDKKLPGEIRDQYLRTVTTVKEQMKKSKTLSDTAFGKAFYRFLKDLMNPVQWISLVKNGDLGYDIEKLMNKLDALSNNSLYYRSAQLQALRR